MRKVAELAVMDGITAGMEAVTSIGCVLMAKNISPKSMDDAKSRVNTNDYAYITDIYTGRNGKDRSGYPAGMTTRKAKASATAQWLVDGLDPTLRDETAKDGAPV